MNFYAFSQMLKDMLRVNRVIPWVLIAIVLGGAGVLWVTYSSGIAHDVAYGAVARQIVYRIVALAAAIFVASIVSQEVEQLTIEYTVTRAVPRGVMIVSRCLAAIVAVMLAGSLALGAVGLGMLGGSVLTSSFFWNDLLVILIGATAYCAFFTFITLVINKSMMFCVGFAFFWESFVSNMPGDLYYLSILSYMDAIATHPGHDVSSPINLIAGSGANTIPVWAGWTVLLGIGVAMMALSAYWFSTREFLPREGAE
ncbi:MAG: hypothetical protein IH944_07670 [Armatimonadetes bacterium]|nr:hypothetical protein [Armatimonadota bacterium]